MALPPDTFHLIQYPRHLIQTLICFKRASRNMRPHWPPKPPVGRWPTRTANPVRLMPFSSAPAPDLYVLTSYVGEQLNLRPNVFALDLVGQGCGAALPNFRAAEAILKAGEAQKVLSVCVEICSAAFFLDDDPGVLISACLFGDGAGAAVLSSEKFPGRRSVEWKFAASRHAPEKRDILRFSHKNGMLRNILLPEVPRIAGEEVAKLFAESLAATGIKREQITGWILHTGGRDVLSVLRGTLDLTETDVRHSVATLREFGNISSPTVYFVLQAALNDPVPDGLWWMSAFGAGFSSHGAFLEIGK